MWKYKRLEDVKNTEGYGFLSEKPQGRGPSAAAASGTAHEAEQGHCLNAETDSAPCQEQGRSAHPTLVEYLATGVRMKTKKVRYETPGLLEQVRQEDVRTQEDSWRRLAAPQLQQN